MSENSNGGTANSESFSSSPGTHPETVATTRPVRQKRLFAKLNDFDMSK